ncbi:putative glycosidase CRH2 [Saitoella coloradoensis]
MVRLAVLVPALLSAAAFASAAITCSEDSPCPESAPCCSQYGQCGIGAYCLGGCDPRFSYEPGACLPAPVCKSETYTFTSTDNIASSGDYLGDPDSYDWTVSGTPLIYDDSILLTMPANSGGTVLAATRYVWYGKVSATLKTSHEQGVVTAFIALSDVKDEIDFEWVGANLTTTQTNYFWQATLDYQNGGNISSSDTYANWHTYEIDWQEDYITWAVDGVIGRTKYKNETWNATGGFYAFPQTPSRVQLSIWPGGASSNAEGTIAWAGGAIDWDSQDIQDYGYYYTMVKNVTIECYDPPSNVTRVGDTAYWFDPNGSYLADDVIITGNATTIQNILDTGLNRTATASASSTATAATDPNTGDTVYAGADSNRGSSNSDSSSASTTAGSTATATVGTSFSQGTSSKSTSGAAQLFVSGAVLLGAAAMGLVLA